MTLKCEKIIDEIEGCEFYRNATECAVCEMGRFLAYSGTKCELLEAKGNCNGYSRIFCRECESGTILNLNSYVYSLTSLENLGDITLLPFFEGFDVRLGYFRDVCKAIDVMYCENFVSFEECKICVFGYYLDNGKCLQYPSEIIPECEEYDSFTSCFKCRDGYHINPSKRCDQNEKIENCLEYDSKATQTVCRVCEDDFFLLSDTNCKIRTITEISNCEKLSKTSEKCENCNDGYTQTNDFLACLPELLRCKTYESSTKSSESLTCNTCEENYYKTSENLCISGNILNCQIYNNDQTCQKCKNKYFLENSICSPHSEILSCSLYNLTEKDQCFQCDLESLTFAVENICKETEKIEGCKKYSSATTCFECDQGYYLNIITCVKIPESKNCLVFDLDADKCLKCKMNFVLFDGVCVLVMNVVSEFCEKVGLDDGVTSLKNARCEFCQENAVFFDVEEFVCVGKEWVGVLISTVIEHCAKYVEAGGVTKCEKCEFGFFLVSDTECAVECPEMMVIFSIVNNDPAYSLSDKSYECKDYVEHIFTPNCKISLAPSLDNQTDYVSHCIKCVSDYKIIFMENGISVPIKDYNPLINNGYPTDPVSNFPVIMDCSDINPEDFFTGLGPIENCEYYDNSNIGCVKCKHGYTGATLQSDGPGSQAYITSCKPYECTKEITPGLPVFLNSYLSCHKCSSDKLPVLFGNAGATYTTITSLATYTLNSQTSDWTTGNTGESIQCLSPSELSSLSTITPMNTPDFCAILFMNVQAANPSANSANLTAEVDINELAVMCVACEKGYKRTMGVMPNSNELDLMVGSCTKILNCKASAWFNYCSECEEGFSHEWKSTGVDYASCVESSDFNCFAGEVNDCKICRKGYRFNLDGVCEFIVMPKCLLSGGRDIVGGEGFIATFLYLSPQGAGCVQCEENYVAVKTDGMDFNSKVCVPSEYAKAHIFKDGEDNYIENCKNYYLEGTKLLCKYCLVGSVVSQNGAICYPIQDLLFCEIATNSTSCSQCIKTHISVSGLCKKKEINNCKVYVLDSVLTKQKCQQCEPLYFISDSNCEKGNVNNCEIMGTDPDICTECFTNYEKVTDSEGHSYCFPHDPTFNCAEFEKAKFEQQIIECKTCKSDSNYYISTNASDYKSSICSKFTDVPNCKIKKVGNSFATSTFMCLECEDGYYSKNGNCTLRTNLHSSCEKYSLNQDLCEKCLAQNFLSTSKKECHPFPKGIIGCRVYTSATKCVGCLQNYYLSGDNCLQITENNLIPNCIYYSDATICKECKENFFLETNTCLQVKALNCKSAVSPNKCGSCFSERGLKDEGDKTNCVKPEDAKCSLFTPKYPFECEECEKGYYVGEERICVPVESSVENCEVYKSKELCKRCRKGYVLGKNFDLCMSYSYLPIDKRCEDSVETGGFNCVVCQGGFFMGEDGECKGCQASDCYFCDPLDSSVCLVCKPGSFMGEDFKCVLVEEEVEEVEEEFWDRVRVLLGIFVVLFV